MGAARVSITFDLFNSDLFVQKFAITRFGLLASAGKCLGCY